MFSGSRLAERDLGAGSGHTDTATEQEHRFRADHRIEKGPEPQTSWDSMGTGGLECMLWKGNRVGVYISSHSKWNSGCSWGETISIIADKLCFILKGTFVLIHDVLDVLFGFPFVDVFRVNRAPYKKLRKGGKSETMNNSILFIPPIYLSASLPPPHRRTAVSSGSHRCRCDRCNAPIWWHRDRCNWASTRRPSGSALSALMEQMVPGKQTKNDP